MSQPLPAKSVIPETDSARGAPAADQPVEVEKLTAEEQMALYEEHLKENDSGHRPC